MIYLAILSYSIASDVLISNAEAIDDMSQYGLIISILVIVTVSFELFLIDAANDPVYVR
jgi:hypothetical protein